MRSTQNELKQVDVISVRQKRRPNKGKNGDCSDATAIEIFPCATDDSSASDHDGKIVQRWLSSRGTSLGLGIGTLAAIALGTYFFLDHNEYSVARSRSANVQAIVSPVSLEVHDSPSDCWLVIHGNVYDLTRYAPTHPGGSEWITDFCGMEATRDFDAWHPEVLLKTIPETLLGPFQAEEQNAISPNTNVEASNTDSVERDENVFEKDEDSVPSSLPVDTRGESENEAKDEVPSIENGQDEDNDESTITKDEGTDGVHSVDTAASPVKDNGEGNDSDDGNSNNEGSNNESSTNESSNNESANNESIHPVPPVETIASPTIQPASAPAPAPTIPLAKTTAAPSHKPASPTRSPTAAPTEKKCKQQFYTYADVEAHASREDCWYILYDTVYDFTDYIDEHPGGARVVFRECGTDATEVFSAERYHDKALLKSDAPWYLIGKLGDESGLLEVPCQS